VTRSEEEELLRRYSWSADEIGNMTRDQFQAALDQAIKQAEEERKSGKWSLQVYESANRTEAGVVGSASTGTQTDERFDFSKVTKSPSQRRGQTYRRIGLICGLVLLAAGLCLWAFDKPEKVVSKDAYRRDTEEVALFRDAFRAGPEIDRRLRERIKWNSSFVIVEDFGSSQVIPTGSAWSASCGFGLTVVIAVAGESEGIRLNISDEFFSEEDCGILLPLTAARVADIFSGNEPKGIGDVLNAR
jgi:hypothetical protein